MSEYQLLRHIGTKLSDDVSGDVAGDADVDRTAVLMWRVSPTRFAEAGRRWSVTRVRRVGARGQSGRRRVWARAGMQDVGSSPGLQQWIRPVVLYTMVCSKTRLENFDF